MRMCKLGHGQSIVCFAPPEVHRSILNSAQTPNIGTDISDVLCWTLEETCLHIDRERVLWVFKGLNHSKRRLAHDRPFLHSNSADVSQIVQSDAVEPYLNPIKDREALSLEEMYFDGIEKSTNLPCGFSDDTNDAVSQNLLSEWRQLDQTAKQFSALQEEQEREVAHEMEQEHQVQRPPKTNQRGHTVHTAVRNFFSKWIYSQPSQRAEACIGTLATY